MDFIGEDQFSLFPVTGGRDVYIYIYESVLKMQMSYRVMKQEIFEFFLYKLRKGKWGEFRLS